MRGFLLLEVGQGVAQVLDLLLDRLDTVLMLVQKLIQELSLSNKTA